MLLDDAKRTLFELESGLVGFDSVLVSLDVELDMELGSVVRLAVLINSDIGKMVLGAVG